MEYTTIVVDLAKSVFQIAVSHRPGDLDEERRLSRGRPVVWHAKKAARPTSLQQWAVQTEQRRGRSVAAVDVANKLARIVWAVWAQQRPFAADPDPRNRMSTRAHPEDCTECPASWRTVGPARGRPITRLAVRGRASDGSPRADFMMARSRTGSIGRGRRYD